MTTITGIADITATSATINLADLAADGTIDMQISPRRDFQFCVCPTFSVARAAAAAVPGLNQRSTYWVRARNRSAAGVGDWGNVEAFRTLDAAAQDTAPAAIMIEPAIIVKPLAPIALATSGDVAGYPVDNLFRDSPVAWRGLPNPNGDYAIYLRLGGQPFDSIALLNHNIPDGVQIYVTGGATQQATDNGADFAYPFPSRASPALPGRPGYHALCVLPVQQRANWVRVLVSGAMVPGGLLHIEHLVVGLNRVSKNHAVEKSETPAPLTTAERKRSGTMDRVRGLPMRKVDFELQMLTEAQYETIYGDLWREENESVLVVPNSKGGAFLHDRILYGELTGSRIVNPTSPRYNRSVTINSII